MEVGESVAPPDVVVPFSDKCPFKAASKSASEEGEDIPDDDTDEVAAAQANNGGVLGENLTEASPGASGTWNGESPPPQSDPDPPKDTYRNDGGWLNVDFGDDRAEYPFIVAAHHLIPGNASLKTSVLFKKYMVKGGKVSAKDKTWTMKEHIGYNVNGSHNGVWLPGNYAIRKSRTCREDGAERPIGFSWGERSGSSGPRDRAWLWAYMVTAVAKSGQRQFHDSHSSYSENVQKVLNKITLQIFFHQVSCEGDCKAQTEVPPPYQLKARLYALSGFLKTKVTGSPASWKFPWHTSDKFKALMMACPARFVSDVVRLS